MRIYNKRICMTAYLEETFGEGPADTEPADEKPEPEADKETAETESTEKTDDTDTWQGG